MQQCFMSYSQQAIDKLFSSSYFIDKFQQLQLQTYQDLIQVQHDSKAKDEKSQIKNKQGTINNSPQKNNKLIQIDKISTQISDLILLNFKETIFKQTNPYFEHKLNMATINEQIQSIKQTINKMSQTTSFIISGKTLPTQQSLTPQKYDRPREVKNKNRNQDKDTSMFIHQDQQSSIELGISRKNLTQDRLGSFSFMNSFLNQNRISPQEQQIINQRINASISKIESSIDDRICQLEKEFTRRIEQIMKTIKHLIQMMNQNQRVQSQSPFGKSNKQYKGEYQSSNIQVTSNFKKSQTQKTVTSKSTIVVPQTSKNEKQFLTGKKNEQIDKLKAKVVMSPQLYNKKKQDNSSSSKLASFFGLGRLKTTES